MLADIVIVIVIVILIMQGWYLEKHIRSLGKTMSLIQENINSRKSQHQ